MSTEAWALTTPPRRRLAAASPCRIHDDAKPHPHACSPQHTELVESYRAARAAAEWAREDATAGYATEIAEYGPLVTFRDWLRARRGGHDEAPGA